MKRLSLRANVLPLLTHSDALSISELEIVKQAVKNDLGKAFSNDAGSGFGIFATVAQEEGEEDVSTSGIEGEITGSGGEDEDARGEEGDDTLVMMKDVRMDIKDVS